MDSMEDAVQVLVHPLALLNLSDHFMRVRALQKVESNSDGAGGEAGALPVVLGALLGTLSGRALEIHNSFEMVAVPCDGDHGRNSCGEDGGPVQFTVEQEFFELRLGQYMEVFPHLEFVGWYRADLTHSASNSAPCSVDRRVLEALKSANDNPYVLLLSPEAIEADGGQQQNALSEKKAPVKIFEKLPDVAGVEFAHRETGFTVTCSEAERIAVDHVEKKGTFAGLVLTKAATAESDEKTEGTGGRAALPQEAQDLVTQAGAVEILQQRLKVIGLYLEAVKEGKVEPDHGLLRAIGSLCLSHKHAPVIPDVDATSPTAEDDAVAVETRELNEILAAQLFLAETTSGVLEMALGVKSASDIRKKPRMQPSSGGKKGHAKAPKIADQNTFS